MPRKTPGDFVTNHSLVHPDGNLVAELPVKLPAEVSEPLLARPGLRLERIVSLGHVSPDGFWYDQPHEEWVLLLAGAARLRFEGAPAMEFGPGDHLLIPRHARHRVEWTDPDQPTVWLALHVECPDRNGTTDPSPAEPGNPGLPAR